MLFPLGIENTLKPSNPYGTHGILVQPQRQFSGTILEEQSSDREDTTTQQPSSMTQGGSTRNKTEIITALPWH
jgi:hypothetical protein